MHGDDRAYYDRVADWNLRPGYRAEVAALIDALELHPGSRVLDLGCGTGTAMNVFAGGGLRPVGLDRSAAWAAACAARPVTRADAAALPFADASFDAVVLIHSYAHLVAPDAALGEARRVLVTAGRIGILTPNRRFLRALRPVSSGHRPDRTVERQRSLGEVQTELAAAGFAIVRAETWGKRPWTLPLAALRERLLVVAQPRT